MKLHLFLVLLLAFGFNVTAQDEPPPPAPKPLSIKPSKPGSKPFKIRIPERRDVLVVAPKIVPLGAWREIISTAGGFKVSFPSEPILLKAPSGRDNVGSPRPNTGTYLLQTSAAYFNLQFDEISAGREDAAKQAEYYDRQSKAFATDETLKLIGERTVKIGEHVGRELITGDKADTTVSKSRIFLVRGYSYEISVTVDKKLFDKQQIVIDRYLDSFQITETPPAPPASAANLIKDNWKLFVAPDNEFKVLFPKVPQREERTAGEKGYQEKQIIYGGNSPMGYYAVLSVELPVTISDVTWLDDFYERIVDTWRKSSVYKVKQLKEVRAGKFTGREFVMTDAEETAQTKVQLFVVGNKLYRVFGVTPTLEDAPKSKVDFYESYLIRFLASFEPNNKIQSVEELAIAASALPENYAGRFEENVYQNDFLGFSLKLPEGWRQLNADEQSLSEESGKQLFQTSDAKQNARLEAAMESAKTLLSITKKNSSALGHSNLTISLQTRNISNSFPLREVALATQKFFQSRANFPLKIVREVYDTKISGRQAFAFELEGAIAGDLPAKNFLFALQ